MKHRLFSLFVFFVIASLLVSGCALSHHAYYFAIDRPYDGQTLPSRTTISLGWHINGEQWPIPNAMRYEVQIFDNALMYTRSYAPFYGNGPGFTFPYVAPDGAHLLYARARVHFTDNSTSDWWQTPTNCVYVGTPPPTYDPNMCRENLNRRYDYNLRPFDLIVTFTPSPAAGITETPTPLIIIRPNSNGNSNGNNSGGKPSASGCAAYTDQSSCNLAGCSWNYGSCVVNP